MATARLTAATLAGVALASSLTACNGDEYAADGSYIYDGEAGTVTARATGAGGNTTMLSGPAIASPLPVDISMMPDAEVTRATHVTAEDGLHIALIEWITEQPTGQVAQYYRAAAAKADLSSALDLAGSNGVTFIAIGENRQRITLHAAPARIAPDGTRLPVPTEGEGANAPPTNGETPPAFRDVTAAQLYLVSTAPPRAVETRPKR